MNDVRFADDLTMFASTEEEEKTGLLLCNHGLNGETTKLLG